MNRPQKIIISLGVSILSGALVLPLAGNDEGIRDVSYANLQLQVIYAVLYAITAIGLIWWRGSHLILRLDTGTKLLLFWASISLLWSSDSALTGRRLLGLLGATLFGVLMARVMTPDQAVRLLALTFVAFAAISFGIEVVTELGRRPDGIHWSGMWTHRQVLGRMASAGLLFLLISQTHARWKLVGGGLFGLLIWNSNALTTALVAGLVLGVFALTKLGKLERPLRAGVVLMCSIPLILTSALSFINGSAILAWLDRTPTLTGRIPLWTSVLEAIRTHPLIGNGFSAFWTGWDGPARQVWTRNLWFPWSAHSAYLDIWVELGLIGVVLIVISAVINLRRAYRARFELPFAWAYLVFLLVFAIPESEILLRANNIFWSLYVYCAIGLQTYSTTSTSTEISAVESQELSVVTRV